MRPIDFTEPVTISWAAVYRMLPEGLRDAGQIREALAGLDLAQLEQEERAKMRLEEFEPGDRLPSGHDPRESTSEGARALYGHFIRGAGRAYCVYIDGQLSLFQTTDLEQGGGPLTADRIDRAANRHAAGILIGRLQKRVADEIAERLARRMLGVTDHGQASAG